MMAFARVAVRTLAWRYRAPSPRLGATAQEICERTVERAWNGAFYQTGLGHFDYFWARDFGVVAGSLVRLGQGERVEATLIWALDKYAQAGRVRSCIDKSGCAFDAPRETIDAVPWLLHALAISGMALSPEQRALLEKELARWCAESLKDGLPREGLAEMRDAVIYKQSAYALCMLELARQACQTLKLEAPALEGRDYPALLEKEYWNGSYFKADAATGAFSAECNLVPFWLGIIDDAEKLQSVLRTIQEKRLQEPVAMRYTDEPRAFRYRWWARTIMRDYAGTTIWSWMGVMYLGLLARAGAPEYGEERAKFAKMIERIGAFPELLRRDGTLYETPFYRAECGMLWAALYLALPHKQ